MALNFIVFFIFLARLNLVIYVAVFVGIMEVNLYILFLTIEVSLKSICWNLYTGLERLIRTRLIRISTEIQVSFSAHYFIFKG